MSFLPDYSKIQLQKGLTMDERRKMATTLLEEQDHEMTPEELLERANQLESGTYRGKINLATSWDETIKQLRKLAYEELNNK